MRMIKSSVAEVVEVNTREEGGAVNNIDKTLPEAQRTQKLTPRLGLNLATTWHHLH